MHKVTKWKILGIWGKHSKKAYEITDSMSEREVLPDSSITRATQCQKRLVREPGSKQIWDGSLYLLVAYLGKSLLKHVVYGKS